MVKVIPNSIFWIPVALAEICVSRTAINRAKKYFVLVGTVLKRGKSCLYNAFVMASKVAKPALINGNALLIEVKLLSNV